MVHSRNFKLIRSKMVSCIGDIDLNKKQILIHKDMPKKFNEGIAVHELEERKWIKKGHSYGYSHQKAQKKELNYYKEKFGNMRKAKSFLNEEEKNVNKIFLLQANSELNKPSG